MYSEKNNRGFGAPLMIGIIAIALILAGGMYYVFQQYNALPSEETNSATEKEKSSKTTEKNGTTGSDTMMEPNGAGMMESPHVETVSLTAKSFSFSQTEIRVKKGGTVKINLASTDGFHDLVIDEFNARTSRISTGQSASTEFVASKTGTFEYYCSVGTHRQMGMVGQLIVE